MVKAIISAKLADPSLTSQQISTATGVPEGNVEMLITAAERALQE